MPVRPGARAAAAGLDPEQVVEQRHDEVVVQVATAWAAYDEGHDRQPVGVEVPEDLQVGVLPPRRDRALEKGVLAGPDQVGADGGLELEDQPGPDGLDDGGRPALLALLRVGQVAVLGRVDVGDGASAGHDGDPVGEQFAAADQHAGSPGPADELVRRQHDRVLV